jgi:hypothetical protein
MKNNTFLDKLAHQILQDFQHNLENITIVLPNKRAKVFLLNELNKHLNHISFAPKIISIEELIQEIADIRIIDSVQQIFEFYDVYKNTVAKEKVQDFETFAVWAKTAIQDFNEIDRYNLEPNKVFSYLEDIEALKRWDLKPEDKTALIDEYLFFWKQLPIYYKSFYNYLKDNKIGYQGLVYKEATLKIDSFSDTLSTEAKYIFAGFNALNQSEEVIFKHLLLQDKAKIYWDIDVEFLKDTQHDVGLFIRKYKNHWKNFSTKPFEWIVDEFNQTKNIEIIGTPKSVGQAKIAGTIIEKLVAEGKNLDKTAIVLGDENLLIPILYSLPNTVNSLNITMGYSAKNNPVQLLIQKLFKLHTNAIARSESSYTLYYKDVLEVLNHSLIEPYLNLTLLVKAINEQNFTYFSLQTLIEVKEKYYPNNENSLFDLLFIDWNTSPDIILNKLNELLLQLKTFLNLENEQEKVTLTFIYSIYNLVNKIISYQEKYNNINSLKALSELYKQVIDLADVSFEGEPLTGLQIMGVLESRVLDFENVIITSVNEGKFPSAKTAISFIPYDVKKELELPTYKEKDAIYSYHFYHLLLRAKNIYLLYNTDSSEGIDAGEKSRFITQLLIEKRANHKITESIYNAVLPKSAYEVMRIPKTAETMLRLHEIATEKGFSPSSLTSYIRNPIQFCFQRVLKVRETDEVEESIAVNTLGTIIHEVLEALYLPYIDTFLTVLHIDAMIALIDQETQFQFKEVYKEGGIKKGKNLLAFEVAKRNIYNFLITEKKAIEADDAVKIMFLEAALEVVLEDKRLPYPVKIAGKVDRIEQRNGVIRIIDYKTGRVEANSLKINEFENLTSDLKNEKIIQLLCYALMYQNDSNTLPIEAGIISFKNMKSGFMPFGIGKGRGVVAETIISETILMSFKEEIITLILEILDAEKPFEEKI